jgi:hypothetical protein
MYIFTYYICNEVEKLCGLRAKFCLEVAVA